MLTPRLDHALEVLFAPSETTAARSLIEEHDRTSASQVPPGAAERIAAAALKLSDGSVSRLETALRASRLDWRDVLMAAGFGHDLAAHEAWLDVIETR